MHSCARTSTFKRLICVFMPRLVPENLEKVIVTVRINVTIVIIAMRCIRHMVRHNVLPVRVTAMLPLE